MTSFKYKIVGVIQCDIIHTWGMRVCTNALLGFSISAKYTPLVGLKQGWRSVGFVLFEFADANASQNCTRVHNNSGSLGISLSW